MLNCSNCEIFLLKIVEKKIEAANMNLIDF